MPYRLPMTLGHAGVGCVADIGTVWRVSRSETSWPSTGRGAAAGAGRAPRARSSTASVPLPRDRASWARAGRGAGPAHPRRRRPPPRPARRPRPGGGRVADRRWAHSVPRDQDRPSTAHTRQHGGRHRHRGAGPRRHPGAPRVDPGEGDRPRRRRAGARPGPHGRRSRGAALGRVSGREGPRDDRRPRGPGGVRPRGHPADGGPRAPGRRHPRRGLPRRHRWRCAARGVRGHRVRRCGAGAVLGLPGRAHRGPRPRARRHDRPARGAVRHRRGAGGLRVAPRREGQRSCRGAPGGMVRCRRPRRP